MSEQYECTECRDRFDSKQGMKIHRGRVHRSTSDEQSDNGETAEEIPERPPSRERVPAIIRHEVQAGLEMAEGYLHRAETAETEREREQFHRLVEFQMRAVKNSV